MTKISSEIVRADFNDAPAVIHYTRAAHRLGLWKSERRIIEEVFPDRTVQLLEAGCGAGRVTLGLWEMGYRLIIAFDFAEGLLDQARSLARERGAWEEPAAIRFLHADVTRLSRGLRPSRKKGETGSAPLPSFAGALFMFNGLMQIPGRANRRRALREIRQVCSAGAPLLFTTHDRDSSRLEQALWRLEAERWSRGEQDTRLTEFGDRYFEDEAGRTFMHLPNRKEVLADLAATGWRHDRDILRRELAREPAAVLDFSDECRFWVARACPRTSSA